MPSTIVQSGQNAGSVYRSLVMQPTRRRLAATPQGISGEEVRTLLADLFETLDVEIDVPEFGPDWPTELRQFITNVKAVLKPAGSESTAKSDTANASDQATELLSTLSRKIPAVADLKASVRRLGKQVKNLKQQKSDERMAAALRARGIEPGWQSSTFRPSKK